MISRKATPSKFQDTVNQRSNAVGYVRVSTEEQATEGFSLDAQMEKLMGYAASKDFNLVTVYREEGISGKVPLVGRPEGSKLVEAFRKRGKEQIGHILAVKLDRLFRNTQDALSYAMEWDKGKTALHILDMSGSAVDTRSAMGRMFFTMAAGFAEMERSITGERVSTALQHLRMSGQVYTRIIPYGFERVDDVENGKIVRKRLVPIPAEIEVIEWIIQQRKEGKGTRLICNELRKRGVPTKKGGKWHPITVGEILRMYESGEAPIL